MMAVVKIALRHYANRSLERRVRGTSPQIGFGRQEADCVTLKNAGAVVQQHRPVRGREVNLAIFTRKAVVRQVRRTSLFLDEGNGGICRTGRACPAAIASIKVSLVMRRQIARTDRSENSASALPARALLRVGDRGIHPASGRSRRRKPSKRRLEIHQSRSFGR